MQILFEKISSEDFSVFLRIQSLSKMFKSPNYMRGKQDQIRIMCLKKAKIIIYLLIYIRDNSKRKERKTKNEQ